MIIYNKNAADKVRRDINVLNTGSRRTIILNASRLTESNKQFLKSLHLILKNNE